MGRRILVVAAVGVAVTLAAVALTAAADLSSLDADRVIPLAVLALGAALTAVATVVAALEAHARDRLAAEAEAITARLREHEHDLVRSNRELERFATVAAHYLQEPLRAILTFTSLIERKYGPSMEGEALSYLLRVSAAGQRMRALIESLLIYARIGQAERQFAVVELRDCVDAALANVEGLALETGARIEVGELPAVRGNAEALTQLFTNLLSNALKYRLGEPRVTISAVRGEHDWIISVADNGRGIDPANHEKIFELFRRLEPGSEVPGTGLGLAISARVVDLHGGRIWVRSTVGQGATFSFTIPLTAERQRRRREPA